MHRINLHILVIAFFFLSVSCYADIHTRIKIISNSQNNPKSGSSGILILDVHARSDDGQEFIRAFQNAVQLDPLLQSQNPQVSFSEHRFPADDIGFGPNYNQTEDYQASDGRIRYIYTYNTGTPGTIDTSYTPIVRITIAYDVTDNIGSLSWYDGLPHYFVIDFNNNDKTGDEGDIVHVLTDITPAEFFPQQFKLHPNFPNPFNPSTHIRFDIPETVLPADVNIAVYNISGQHVRHLTSKEYPAGSYLIEWDGRNDLGQLIGSGVYLVVFRSRDFLQTDKTVLLR